MKEEELIKLIKMLSLLYKVRGLYRMGKLDLCYFHPNKAVEVRIDVFLNRVFITRKVVVYKELLPFRLNRNRLLSRGIHFDEVDLEHLPDWAFEMIRFEPTDASETFRQIMRAMVMV